MKIGRRIRNLRLKKGLTQEELGERTDLTKGYISQIERDLSSPSMETFFDILEVSAVRLGSFLMMWNSSKRLCTEKKTELSL